MLKRLSSFAVGTLCGALLVACGVSAQAALDFAVSAQALLILAGVAVMTLALVWHAGGRLALRFATT
jgi:hypothetical protein